MRTYVQRAYKLKKISQLMNELGFNKESSDSVKEAFVKHLIKKSMGINVQTPSEIKIIQNNPEDFINFPAQLEFDFAEEKPPLYKKA